jgi:hypothetical protein
MVQETEVTSFVSGESTKAEFFCLYAVLRKFSRHPRRAIASFHIQGAATPKLPRADILFIQANGRRWPIGA